MLERLVVSAVTALVLLFRATATAIAAEETAVVAEEEADSWFPGELSGNVGIVTDYAFRGLSQTQRDPALQGGLDWAHDSGLFLGLWGSTIKFAGDDSYLEQDFYGGYGSAIGAFSWDARAVYFYYPKEEHFDYWEFVFNGAYDFERFSAFGTFLGAPDYLGSLGLATYLSGGIEVPLPIASPWVAPSLRAAAGWTETDEPIDDDDSYLDWNAGLLLALPVGLTLDFRYVDTDAKGYGDDADARFVFGAVYAF